MRIASFEAFVVIVVLFEKINYVLLTFKDYATTTTTILVRLRKDFPGATRSRCPKC